MYNILYIMYILELVDIFSRLLDMRLLLFSLQFEWLLKLRKRFLLQMFIILF